MYRTTLGGNRMKTTLTSASINFHVYITHYICSWFRQITDWGRPIIPSKRLDNSRVKATYFCHFPNFVAEHLAVTSIRRTTIVIIIKIWKLKNSSLCALKTQFVGSTFNVHTCKSKWIRKLKYSLRLFISYLFQVTFSIISWSVILYIRNSVMVLHNCHSLSCKLQEHRHCSTSYIRLILRWLSQLHNNMATYSLCDVSRNWWTCSVITAIRPTVCMTTDKRHSVRAATALRHDNWQTPWRKTVT